MSSDIIGSNNIYHESWEIATFRPKEKQSGMSKQGLQTILEIDKPYDFWDYYSMRGYFKVVL